MPSLPKGGGTVEDGGRIPGIGNFLLERAGFTLMIFWKQSFGSSETAEPYGEYTSIFLSF